MRHFEDGGRWYALFVLTGEEDKVKNRLEYRFRDSKLKFIVPKRKLMERKEHNWEEKVRTIFPGYILVNGYIGVEDYYFLVGIPGLLRVLKDTCEPLEIPEQDIAVLKKLICNSDIIEHSSVLVESGKVVVVDGPLLGLEGLIQSIDKRKGRARVRLNFACEPRLVDLSIFIIQPV
jgi:transcription termination/antitermination protein NusG